MLQSKGFESPVKMQSWAWVLHAFRNVATYIIIPITIYYSKLNKYKYFWYNCLLGDDRANENLHLTTMHLIWARQHNRISAILREHNLDWNDTTVFEESRKILGAQMQHITYNEFLPNILGKSNCYTIHINDLVDCYKISQYLCDL